MAKIFKHEHCVFIRTGPSSSTASRVSGCWSPFGTPGFAAATIDCPGSITGSYSSAVCPPPYGI